MKGTVRKMSSVFLLEDVLPSVGNIHAFKAVSTHHDRDIEFFRPVLHVCCGEVSRSGTTLRYDLQSMSLFMYWARQYHSLRVGPSSPPPVDDLDRPRDS